MAFKQRQRVYCTHEEYEDYLQSEQWADKRRQRLQVDGYRCRGCGRALTEETAHIHHLNYYYIGAEDVWTDIVSLCADCHKRTHTILNRPTGINSDNTVRYGWKATVPSFIVEDLRDRGLM